jgi:hypothetical protein
MGTTVHAAVWLGQRAEIALGCEIFQRKEDDAIRVLLNP